MTAATTTTTTTTTTQCHVCGTRTDLYCEHCHLPTCSIACHAISTTLEWHCPSEAAAVSALPSSGARANEGGADAPAVFRVHKFKELPRLLNDDDDGVYFSNLKLDIQSMGDAAVRRADVATLRDDQRYIPRAIWAEEAHPNDDRSQEMMRAVRDTEFTDIDTFMNQSWWDAPLEEQHRVLTRTLARLLKTRYYKLEFPNLDQGPVFDVLMQRKLLAVNSGGGGGGTVVSSPSSPYRSSSSSSSSTAASSSLSSSSSSSSSASGGIRESSLPRPLIDDSSDDASSGSSSSGSTNSNKRSRKQRKTVAAAAAAAVEDDDDGPKDVSLDYDPRNILPYGSRRQAAPARDRMAPESSAAQRVYEDEQRQRAEQAQRDTDKAQRRVGYIKAGDTRTMWSDYLLDNASSISSLESLITDVREQLRTVDRQIKTQNIYSSISDAEHVTAYVEWRAQQRALWASLQRKSAGWRPRTIIGQHATRRRLNEGVYTPLMLMGAADIIGVSPSNVLLYGPGGTGKTLLSHALSAQCNLPLFEINASDIQSSFQAESKINFAMLMRAAHVAANSTGKLRGARRGAIIFLEEADALLETQDGASGNSSNSNNDTSIVSEFKARFDQERPAGAAPVIFIAATNYPEKIRDAAVLRRLPLKLYVGLPSAKERAELVLSLLHKAYGRDVVEQLYALGRPRAEHLLSDHPMFSDRRYAPTGDVETTAWPLPTNVFHFLSAATAGLSQGEIVSGVENLVAQEMALKLNSVLFVRDLDEHPTHMHFRELPPNSANVAGALTIQQVNAAVLDAQLGGGGDAQQNNNAAAALSIRFTPIAPSVLTGRLSEIPRNITDKSIDRYAAYAAQNNDVLNAARITVDRMQFDRSLFLLTMKSYDSARLDAPTMGYIGRIAAAAAANDDDKLSPAMMVESS